jgi:[2Fe-2S] binding domain/Molybdopterin-binding domain of aldehyde dehydrogenase
VLVDGERILPCLALAVQFEGREITTIEGLASGHSLHPLRQAFIDHDGFQWGYCTPGQICSAMGIGLALMEETQFDERNGRTANPSLAEYHVPVHMDVPEIDVIWADIPDPHAPMGARGIGEIGITGAGAVIANAIYNACGKRVRELPIALDSSDGVSSHRAAVNSFRCGSREVNRPQKRQNRSGSATALHRVPAVSAERSRLSPVSIGPPASPCPL